MNATDSATCFIGYCELCGLQRRAVASLVSGKDVFVCIPTGGGKLLCYSILLQAFNFREKESGMVIVISPLVPFNLDPVCKFLEQALYGAKHSVAVLHFSLLTQPCNPKHHCLLGYAKFCVILAELGATQSSSAMGPAILHSCSYACQFLTCGYKYTG